MAATTPPLSNSMTIPTHLCLRSRATGGTNEFLSSTTPRDDPLRILVPAQKKLSTIESQRVLAIVSETSRQLELALLIPTLVNSAENLSVLLGSELVSLVQDYKQFTAEFMALKEKMGDESWTLASNSRTTSCTSTGSESMDSQLFPVESGEERRLYHLQKCIRHNVKSILRALSSNPTIIQAVNHKKVPFQTSLVEGFQSLYSVSNETLLTTRLEEVKRREHLELVTSRRHLMEDTIKNFEIELDIAQSLKEKEVSAKEDEINNLQKTTVSVATTAQETARKMQTEAKKQQTSAETTHTNTKTNLDDEIGVLKKQLQDSVGEHKERELETRKKTFKRELEVENWIKKYDEEMGEKQDELEMLQEQFTAEKKQLKELEEKLGILKLKYDVAIKEQEEARLKAEQEAQERGRRTLAASRIQRCWRAYHKRGVIEMEQSGYTVREDNGEVTVCAVLKEGDLDGLSVDIQLSRVKCLLSHLDLWQEDISIQDDSKVEAVETFKVLLESTSNLVTLPTTYKTTVMIISLYS